MALCEGSLPFGGEKQLNVSPTVSAESMLESMDRDDEVNTKCEEIYWMRNAGLVIWMRRGGGEYLSVANGQDSHRVDRNARFAT